MYVMYGMNDMYIRHISRVVLLKTPPSFHALAAFLHQALSIVAKKLYGVLSAIQGGTWLVGWLVGWLRFLFEKKSSSSTSG